MSEAATEFISLDELRSAGRELMSSEGGSLIDLGDGCGCIEFHSKMNTLSPDLVAFMVSAHERCAQEFRALVIGNQGRHFSAGYDLNFFLDSAAREDWNRLDRMLFSLQQACMAIKYSPIPVVAAIFGYTLGGGVECELHCAMVQATEHLVIGLPEPSIGVLPAGGATKELIARFSSEPKSTGDLFVPAKRAYDAIVTHGNQHSADSAKQIGLLRDTDGISADTTSLLSDAKRRALALADSGYAPPELRPIPVLGEEAYVRLSTQIDLRLAEERMSEHDAFIARQVAWVVSAARLTPRGTVSEQHLLDLERESFIALMKTPQSQERMRYTLDTGKHLRN